MPALRWASCCSPSSCWRPKVFPGSLDAAAMLELRGVSKRFGGVVATDDVTLEIARGQVHALIGPNGAGKTTLIGQISGALPTDSGRILFNGAEVTNLAAHARLAAGRARSY